MDIRVISGKEENSGNLIEISSSSVDTAILIDTGCALNPQDNADYYKQCFDKTLLHQYPYYEGVFVSYNYNDYNGLCDKVIPGLHCYIDHNSAYILSHYKNYQEAYNKKSNSIYEFYDKWQKHIGYIQMISIESRNSPDGTYMFYANSENIGILYARDMRDYADAVEYLESNDYKIDVVIAESPMIKKNK